MRPTKPLLLAVLVFAWGGLACDRVNDLKDRLLGTSQSDDGGNPELEAIKNLYESGQYDATIQKELDESTSKLPSCCTCEVAEIDFLLDNRCLVMNIATA